MFPVKSVILLCVSISESSLVCPERNLFEADCQESYSLTLSGEFHVFHAETDQIFSSHRVLISSVQSQHQRLCTDWRWSNTMSIDRLDIIGQCINIKSRPDMHGRSNRVAWTFQNEPNKVHIYQKIALRRYGHKIIKSASLTHLEAKNEKKKWIDFS